MASPGFSALGLVVLGLLLGLVLGVVAVAALQRRHAAAVAALRDEGAAAASQAAADAAERTRTLFAAQQDAALAQLRQQEAEVRSAMQAELAAALASVDELRDAAETTRQQHAEYVEAQRRERAERTQQEAGQVQVLQKLAPVAEQLKTMEDKVNELEKARSEQHGQLAAQIRQAQISVEESKKAAEGLAAALKNNAVRGVWGETQLRTLVEAAGMVNHVDFSLQQSITADSGDRRPDMVVRLPGGLEMPVDAKVPYNSFVAAYEPGISDQDRARLLVEHARKVKGHIDALARKEYWTGLDSPELVVVYIPNDQLLAAALDSDAGLLDHAFSKGVVLATPTNLLSLLKTVALAWRQETLTEDAQKVFATGQELYRRIGKVAEHADKLRRSLESTVKNYNEFASSLESRVLPAARRLDAAGAPLGVPRQIEAHTKRFASEELAEPGQFDDLAALRGIERPELELDLGIADGEADAEAV